MTQSFRSSLIKRSARWLAVGGLGAFACNVYNADLLAEADGGVGGTSGSSSAGTGGSSGGSSGSAGSGPGGTSGTGASSGTGGTAGSGASSGSGPERWWETVNDCPMGGGAGGVQECGAPGCAANNECNGCESAGLPTSSDRDGNDPGDDLSPIYVAMNRIFFGAANNDTGVTENLNAWRDIGFDIDSTCTKSATCTLASDDSTVRAFSCKNDIKTTVDGNRCIDNAIGALFPIAAQSPQVGGLFGVTEQHWNCALHAGLFSVMLKISGYNGKANDNSVRVDLYSSQGLETLPNYRCDSGPGLTPPPTWSSEAPWLKIEKWKIAARSIDAASPDRPGELKDAKVRDGAAFVRNGYLFMNLPAASEFWLNGERAFSIPGFRLSINRGRMVAKIQRAEDDTWELQDGTIGGVVEAGEMIAGFREIGFCDNMCESYTSVIGYLNSQKDVLLSTDEPLPDIDCDGLSIGMTFTAREASFGSVEAVTPPVDCPPPRNPAAPPHGCVCMSGTCTTPGGGSGGMGGSTSGGSSSGGSSSGGSGGTN